MHVRTQIRKQIVKALTGLPTTGDNVFVDYIYSVSDKSLPCLSVVTGSDTYERMTLGKPSILDVTTEFNIYAACKINDTYQDTAEQILLEIQQAINSDVTLNQMVMGCFITNANVTTDNEADKPLAFLEVGITTRYRIREDNPEVII